MEVPFINSQIKVFAGSLVLQKEIRSTQTRGIFSNTKLPRFSSLAAGSLVSSLGILDWPRGFWGNFPQKRYIRKSPVCGRQEKFFFWTNKLKKNWMSSQKAFSKLQIKPNTTQLDMNTPKNRQTSAEPPWTVAWSLPHLFHPFWRIRDKFFFISEVQGNEKGSRLWNSGRDLPTLGWLVEVGWGRLVGLNDWAPLSWCCIVFFVCFKFTYWDQGG